MWLNQPDNLYTQFKHLCFNLEMFLSHNELIDIWSKLSNTQHRQAQPQAKGAANINDKVKPGVAVHNL